MDLFNKEIRLGNIAAMDIVGTDTPPDTEHPVYIAEYDAEGNIKDTIKRYANNTPASEQLLSPALPFQNIMQNHILVNVDTKKHKTIYVTLIKKPVVNFN